MATPSRQICARMMVHLAVLPAINNRQRALSVRDILARSPSVAMVGQARSHGSVPGGRTVSNNCTACQPETPHEPCQRQITAQDLRQDAPTDGLSMDRSQTLPLYERLIDDGIAAAHAGSAPSITSPPGGWPSGRSAGPAEPGCDHRRRQGPEPGGQPTSNPPQRPRSTHPANVALPTRMQKAIMARRMGPRLGSGHLVRAGQATTSSFSSPVADGPLD